MQSGIFILKTCIQTVCKAQAIGYIYTEICIKTVCKAQATSSSYTQDVHIEFVQGTCHRLYLHSRRAYGWGTRHGLSAIFVLRTCIQTVCEAPAISYIYTKSAYRWCMRYWPSAIAILKSCIQMVCKAQAISDSYTQDMHIDFMLGRCHQQYLYLRHTYYILISVSRTRTAEW